MFCYVLILYVYLFILFVLINKKLNDKKQALIIITTPKKAQEYHPHHFIASLTCISTWLTLLSVARDNEDAWNSTIDADHLLYLYKLNIRTST